MMLSVHPRVWMDDQIATIGKLLDITYEPYGFSGDLIETIS